MKITIFLSLLFCINISSTAQIDITGTWYYFDQSENYIEVYFKEGRFRSFDENYEFYAELNYVLMDSVVYSGEYPVEKITKNQLMFISEYHSDSISFIRNNRPNVMYRFHMTFDVFNSLEESTIDQWFTLFEERSLKHRKKHKR